VWAATFLNIKLSGHGATLFDRKVNEDTCTANKNGAAKFTAVSYINSCCTFTYVKALNMKYSQSFNADISGNRSKFLEKSNPIQHNHIWLEIQ
jgi:hypothetical protein